MVLMCASSRVEAEFPPIQWGGDLTLSYRTTGDDAGQDSDQWGATLNLQALSYIYEPWVATWYADVGLTRLTTSVVDRDSDSQILTGQAQVNLLPQSQFPGQLFFEATDSRTSADLASLEFGDYRLYHYGYRQQYQDASGNTSFFGSYEGFDETRLNTGDQIDTQQLRLEGTHRRGNHVFDANAEAQMTTRDPDSVDNGFYVANVHHGFTPSAFLSVDTSASAFYTEAETPRLSSSEYGTFLNNRVDWQASDRFRLTTDANVEYRQIDLGAATGDDFSEQRADLSVLGVYDLRSDLTVSGSLTGQAASGNVDTYSSTQSLLIDYYPQVILFDPFSYSYSLSAAVRNLTAKDRDSVQNYRGNASHGINYSTALGDANWTLAADFTQDLTAEEDTELGDLTTLSNRATATASQAGGSGTLFGQLRLLDFRAFGRRENELQTVDLTVTSSSQFGRYQALTLSLSGSAGRSEDARTSNRFAAATAGVEYLNSRLFEVPNLTFESRFRADYNLSRSEVEIDPEFDFNLPEFSEDERYQVFWRNELDYAIGRLSVTLTADIVHSDAGERWSVFASATRRF